MSGTADATVLYEVDDRVAIITFNRPDRLNAWTGPMEAVFRGHFDAAVADPDVKVIVIAGAGKGWCAGADMDLLQGIGDDGEPVETASPDANRIVDCPKPVIAAINGACAGLGFTYALACDLRFAAEGAKFTTAFAHRGLIAEYGMSWTLPRLIGQGAALDLLLSGRIFKAEEAKELGLVNRVVAPDDLLSETLTYARQLADHSSPTSMKIMKQQVYGHYEQTREEALAESIKLMGESLQRNDFKEGVASFVKKRRPNFEPVTD